MAHLSNDPTTKDKLQSIVQGFDDFDAEMRRGTRVCIRTRVFPQFNAN